LRIGADPVLEHLDALGDRGPEVAAVDEPLGRGRLDDTADGLGQSGTPFCSAFGTTTPFTQQQLDTLYRNHGRFVAAWSTATLRALLAGFLRPEDAVNMLVVGARADIP
jgi:hypothetical protein